MESSVDPAHFDRPPQRQAQLLVTCLHIVAGVVLLKKIAGILVDAAMRSSDHRIQLWRAPTFFVACNNAVVAILSNTATCYLPSSAAVLQLALFEKAVHCRVRYFCFVLVFVFELSVNQLRARRYGG